MKSLVIVLFAAFWGAEVCAQNCYQCQSVSTSEAGINLPDPMEPLLPSCDGQTEIVNCSRIDGRIAGCSKAVSNFQFDVPGYGRVSFDMLSRSCGPGAALDSCLSDSEVQQGLDSQLDFFQTLLPSGSTFVSSSGALCMCSSNLCNGSPVWKGSFAVLLLSLLFSYVAIKW